MQADSIVSANVTDVFYLSESKHDLPFQLE